MGLRFLRREITREKGAKHSANSSTKMISIIPEQDLIFNNKSLANSKQTIQITNTFSAPIAFKVKTTSPKQFAVRPNAGRLEPGEKAEVSVLLQQKDFNALDGKKRDKFLVQAIKLPATLQLNDEQMSRKIQELWTQAEEIRKAVADPSQSDIISEKKLRCVYVSDDQASQPGISRQPTTIASDRASLNQYTESEPHLGNDVQKDRNSVTESLVENKETPKPTEESSQRDKDLLDLRDRLAILQAACDGYKAELDRVNLLRQRRADSAVPPTSTVAAPAIDSGKQKEITLALNVVATLCLISFLFGIWLI